MWSTPVVALAVLAIAYASPLPVQESSLSETTTHLTTLKDEALPTTTVSHSLSTEGKTKVTKEHFTFKPHTFKPRTHKPIKHRTVTPTTHEPITTKVTEHAPIEKMSTGAETTLLTTTAGSSLHPVRNVRAVLGGDGWQLAETPSTVTVLPTLELTTTPFSSTVDAEHSSTITTTAPIFKPLGGLTTVHKDDEITTSTASTAFPTIITTTASLLPKRLVRAAEDGWELEGQAQKVDVTGFSGPGWQISEEKSFIDVKNFTATAATNFSTPVHEIETTTITFAPITADSKLIRPKRHAGFSAEWSLNDNMQEVKLPSDTPSESQSSMFNGPGWQVQESSDKVNIDDNDMSAISSTELSTPIASETTMIDDSDMQPGWQLSQTDSTAVVGDITTSAFTDLPTSTLDFESTMESDDSAMSSTTGFDDTTTSDFTDLPLSSSTVVMPTFGNSLDGNDWN